ncbi:hypothetical protein [Sulfuriflexus sp.]|uniref:hypothetical protein n=1 Tax=Sulfuriflexus sp. TaxID=2015443 RepID=UPI0028CD5AB2|nr:hypothetical protein [Sulfuriflexus sp.]MDT8405532.1 hypothetical protein [Sulfuriflexus sp.]
MSENMDLEGLAIPPQKAPDTNSFDARPKFIAKWIANLPMANLGETSRLVFKAVVEINRLQLSVHDRIKSLEALREPCQYITKSLEDHFAGRPLPLNEKHRKVSELARALTSELAMGYKIVARQLVDTTKHPDQKLLLTALHRSTSYLGLLLLRSYQVYAPYPRNVWRELHTIYRYAEEHALSDSPLKDDMNHLPGGNCTIATMYDKILMLSLAMPYRLHRGEVDKVCGLLNRLIHLVRLEKIPSQQDPQGLFIVNLREDKQPGYLSLYHGNDFQDCRLLNTHDLIITMQRQIAAADPELTGLASMNLLQRLLSSWSIMSKRGFSRIAKQETEVEVAFGISAAHHYINGEKAFVPDENDSVEFTLQNGRQSAFHTTRVSALSDQYTGPDVWTSNYTYSGNDPGNAESATNHLTDHTADNQPFDYRTIRFAMRNTSAGGYCLVSQTDTDFSAHVGDLLAIHEHHDKSIEQWGIGVVRRLLSLGNDSIELGIQMLTPNAVAVAARLEEHDANDRSSEFMRCLMLPELRTIDQPATIITPALPFKQDSHIRINLQDKQIIAILTHQREGTQGFSQFEFRVLHEAEQDETTAKPEGEAETDSGLEFDSLWSTL